MPRASAVIGSGFIGTVHVEAIRRMGCDVKGILASNAVSTAHGSQKLKLRHAYSSIEEICSDEDVDTVHVTSPNALHFPQAMALLQAKKNVMCEKPLALTASEGAKMLETAESKGVKHAVTFNTRFYPMVHEAHARVANGSIGEIRYIKGDYHQDWLLFETDWNWRLIPDEAGKLRAVADIGSHLIDQLSFVSGLEVESVFADLHTFIKTRMRPKGPVQTFTQDASTDRVEVPMNSDDAAGILIRYNNGARATLSISQVSAGRKNGPTWEISGSKAALAFDAMNPDALWIGHRGEANDILYKDPSLLSSDAARITFYPGGHIEGFGETFRGLFETFYSDIENGNMSGRYPTFSDGVRSLRVTDAIAESSQNETWVTVR
jgi:predicted dehydrogenase